jgi:hypothetical protein
MADVTACACSDDVLLCDGCRAGVVELAAAVAEMIAHTRANGVNEIEYADPFTGRVSRMRREGAVGWLIVDVRRLGSAERLRTRPSAGSA